MKYRVTMIDCDREYGEEKVAVEDAQIGDIRFREIECETLAELHEIVREVHAVELSESSFDRFDGDLTLIGREPMR